MNSLTNFHYRYIDNHVEQTLFLLHGTGGSEDDFLPLVAPLKDEYNFVGLRGNVTEGGLARFFKRTAAGVFDQVNIKTEAKKLADFLAVWYAEHELLPVQTAFVGYSNGANMILATMFLYPELFSTVVLLHPMLPLQLTKKSLTGKKVLLSYGTHDQLIPTAASEEVVLTLKTNGAEVTVVRHEGGHQVQQQEIIKLKEFLREDDKESLHASSAT